MYGTERSNSRRRTGWGAARARPDDAMTERVAAAVTDMMLFIALSKWKTRRGERRAGRALEWKVLSAIPPYFVRRKQRVTWYPDGSFVSEAFAPVTRGHSPFQTVCLCWLWVRETPSMAYPASRISGAAFPLWQAERLAQPFGLPDLDTCLPTGFDPPDGPSNRPSGPELK